MRSARHHLALILPLFAILFSVEYLLVFDRITGSYETRLKENYSLILVADRSVKLSDLSHCDTLIEKVEPIDAQKVLRKIKGDMQSIDLEKIKAIMPLFFSIKLKRYADGRRVEKLKSELLSIDGVKDVHIFEKVHERLYAMLLFMKSSFTVFGALIGVISLLLLMKQMTIWQFEHKERMQIMALFGAPLWLRSGVLFRLAVTDALVALILVVSAILYLANYPGVASLLEDMDLDPALLFRPDDVALLAAISFSIALLSAAWVVIRFKEE
ncbi:cell division protein FtsX [Hydrogenimonas sp.]|nr:cell division protein FtsX [Hydrogenimonas sp.]